MNPKERVKELCEKSGISVKRLEKMLGISNGTIGGWDKGNPSMENARKIANHFGVSIEYILTGEEQKPKQEPNTLIAVGTYEVDLVKTFRQLSEVGKMKILLTVYQELQAEQAPSEEKESAGLSTSKAG